MNNLDISSVIIGCVVIGFLIWTWRVIRAKLDEQRYYEDVSAMEFENSVLGMTSTETFRSDYGAAGNSATTVDDSISGAMQLDNPTDSSPRKAEPAVNDKASASERVIDRLTKAGVLNSVEGYREHYGDPRGIAMLRLKNGQTAMLVGHMESAAFLAANERRADMIIVAANDTDVFVIRPFTQLLADNIRL